MTNTRTLAFWRRDKGAFGPRRDRPKSTRCVRVSPWLEANFERCWDLDMVTLTEDGEPEERDVMWSGEIVTVGDLTRGDLVFAEATFDRDQRHWDLVRVLR
jgi:hypothetical protein